MNLAEQQLEETHRIFDIHVTHRDEATGLVTHKTPYIMRAVKSADGGTTKLWERPAGSGNLFNWKNEPIGRWLIDEKTKQGKHVAAAEHRVYVAPLTNDQKLARTVVEKDARIAALEAELASIKTDDVKKKSGS